MPTTNDSEFVKNSFTETLEKYFQKLHLPFFKGGSRRFGYSHEQSDSDYFVLVEDDVVLERLIHSLILVGFSPTDAYYATMNGDGVEKFLALKPLFHVGFLRKEDLYNKLEEEHNRVNLLLAKQPYLRQVARALRRAGTDGTFVYRLFKDLSRSAEK